MILLIGFHTDADPRRQAELLECLRRNLANEHIEQVHAFLEDAPGAGADPAGDPVFASPKLRTVAHGRRVTFRDLFDYANAQLPPGRVAVANADIYFDDTLAPLARADLRGRFLCLSRWDVAPDAPPSHFDREWSQDAWVFEAPVRDLGGDFHLGTPGCDNRLAWEAERAGLVVTNPSRSVRANHLHRSMVRHYAHTPQVPGPYRPVPTGFLETPCPGPRGPAPEAPLAAVAFREPTRARDAEDALPASAGPRAGADAPLISCIMPTYNRRAFVPLALQNFQAQDYPRRELIVIDDGTDPVGDLVAGAPGVRYFRLPNRVTVGEKRNLACDLAAGALIAHWDDDDWYSPDRLSYQAEPVLAGRADVTGLVAGGVLELPAGAYWAISPELHRAMFAGDVVGGTLLFPKAILSERVRYPVTNCAEDADLLRAALGCGFRLCRLPKCGTFVYVRHGVNTWRFTAGQFLHPDGWRRTDLPASFPADLLERYRAAADRHAANASRG